MEGSACAALAAGLENCLGAAPLMAEFTLKDNAIGSADSLLPGTARLTLQGDLAMQMVDGIRRFLLLETDRQSANRSRFWNRDYSSAAAYERSIAENRQRFRRIIGAVDERIAQQAPEAMREFSSRTQIAATTDYRVFAMRWPVFAPVTADSGGLSAEGLLLEPDRPPTARVVAIPDADCTPEMLAGLATGLARESQFAHRLAQYGAQVVVPRTINRADTYSGIPGIGITNMPHREWIYRMAFEAGRHIIGFEVQKILAALDWFDKRPPNSRVPIGVMGYGEGGLLALYSAALDTRIDAVAVSGYFQPREALWQEPIYRDVWGLVREFGDAELAGMIAPRALIVEACKGPEVTGPPQPDAEHPALACPNGRLTSPTPEAVEREIERARPFFRNLGAENRLQLIRSADGYGLPGSDAAIRTFLHALEGKPASLKHPSQPANIAAGYDSEFKLKEQFDELVAFTQAVIRKSPDVRRSFWKHADSTTIRNWKDSTAFYRDYIWNEVIGRLPSPTLPLNPRSRRIFNTPRFAGYEVMLDVWPDVYAYGILLLPNDLKPGERRPVVVCQHGLEGRPQDVADPSINSHFYHHFAADLAEEGFITYAPQNPYIGEDKFRILQRIGHPIKLSLFSVILGQHEQTLRWLSAQPFVDPKRIGFYGLSYGGKTAVRVPPLLDGYALSICSGDFNQWVWKTTTVLASQSYLLTKEYDMYEFNFANIVNYAELAELMAPRPFMVERGHDDPVGLDEWVAFEYARVRELYAKMGIADQTEIEFFSGPHEVHGKGTFRFLKRHLQWPG
jgi:dienelactone hydrolase